MASVVLLSCLAASPARGALEEDEPDDDEEVEVVSRPLSPGHSSPTIAVTEDRLIPSGFPSIELGYQWATSARFSLVGMAGWGENGTEDSAHKSADDPDRSTAASLLRLRFGAQYYLLPGLDAPYLRGGVFGADVRIESPDDGGYGRVGADSRFFGPYAGAGYAWALDAGSRLALGASYAYATYAQRSAHVIRDSNDAPALAARLDHDHPSRSWPTLDLVFGFPL